MIIWVDAQLPPTLAAWIVETFGITAFSLKELGLRDAKDRILARNDIISPSEGI
jgi:predicted nuclease of predicted toxin-antitoxin system